MFKKKDNLLQFIKKDQNGHLSSYLEEQDLFEISLLSKKYYSQLFGAISLIREDHQLATKKNRGKAPKSKPSKLKEEPKMKEEEVEVVVEKVPLHRYKLRSDPKQWRKIDKLPFHNDYLLRKLESRNFTFFLNEESQELIYLNRSMVDPTLNYSKGGFGEAFLDNHVYEHIFTEGCVEQDLSSREAILRRQQEILDKINMKKKEEEMSQVVNYEAELLRAVSMRKIGVILCFGGSFSFGIYEKGKCLVHKSDKKYVVRQKAGQRQFNRDKEAGSNIQSMGSQIRRDQEKKHVINVGAILKEHHSELEECEVIFLQAPGLNRLFVINPDENLEGLQDRLRSVCLTAKKANFTEVEALFEAISQVNVVTIGKREEKSKRKQIRKWL